MIIANRTEELLLFNRMVEGTVAKRILLIKAESGFGKTWLLTRFKHTLPEENVLCVDIDIKSAERGIAYIFDCVPDYLGKKRFPRLNAAMEQYLSSGIEVSDTTMIGKDNQLSVVLSSEDKLALDLRFAKVQEAFFQDLEQIPEKLVFLFDSYQKAPTELANWLSGKFLRQVVKIKKLIVVIAGQEIPEPTVEWMGLHDFCPLGAISELKAWCDYAQNEGLSLNEFQVESAMILCEGQPAKTMTALKTLHATARKRL
ncbi:MAG: hypothetical protein V7L21_30370 [Nostoc sp.]|uniref:hypothetical protein n=1 Tax=Nostoc sp. TaxID=1180 RepID=UPI002FF4C060